MSQNKTIIPDFEFEKPQNPYTDTSANADFYRPSGAVPNSTIISGTNGTVSGDTDNHSTPKINPGIKDNDLSSRAIAIQERVIIGVLFSISRGLLGEIFPIYLGRNIIGTSPSCDICLKEKTVSDEHAVFFVRSDGYPCVCNLTLTDYGSIYGTMVNNQDCRYETLTVKEGDILTVGKHYKLIVKLFDTVNSGLCEDSAFEDNSSSTSAPLPQQSQPNDFYAPSGRFNNDNRTVIG